MLIELSCHRGCTLHPDGEPTLRMDQETLGSIVLLAIVTLISVVQNGKTKISIYLRDKRELRKVLDDIC